ncbi:MAG: helix-turn-helix transcriptional regulator [Leptospirales bacterium]|nr:helix-turn-helix transcriptional regulator [Leptospirales bacterium]
MTFERFQMELGKRIQKLRLERNKTQEGMDEGEWSVPWRTIQDLEGGKSNVTLHTLFKVARSLNIHPREFFDFSFPTRDDRTSRK